MGPVGPARHSVAEGEAALDEPGELDLVDEVDAAPDAAQRVCVGIAGLAAD
ncbi:hypothetical protein ACFWNL_20330 [Kitasatospora sp. NPDC058397]|uniref:hypothetical protein n=1 Tax=unclassified Kitasatospora TaxID=2633591 RepID=UPI003669CEDA